MNSTNDEFDPAELVNLERYAIDDLESAAGRALLDTCQRQLAGRALCALPDFIRPQWLERLTSEASELIPQAHYRDEDTPVLAHYSDHGQADFLVSESGNPYPAEHPRHTIATNRYRQILNNHITGDRLMRRLYFWAPLTEFVRRVFQAKTMYRSQCPVLSLTYKVAGEGDTDGWHYDPNDGVVSLLLQKPDEGGLFEYAPYLRTKDNECHEAVAKLLADPETFGQRPLMDPGTFVFFNGNLSLHRVTPVGTTRQPRIIALLCYDQQPDQVFGQRYIEHLRSFPSDLDRASRGI